MSRKRPGSRKAPPHKRERILARDGWLCLRCGSKEDLTIDHIRPYAEGGRHNDENLQTLCRSCNEAKGNYSISYLPETWVAA